MNAKNRAIMKLWMGLVFLVGCGLGINALYDFVNNNIIFYEFLPQILFAIILIDIAQFITKQIDK